MVTKHPLDCHLSVLGWSPIMKSEETQRHQLNKEFDTSAAQVVIVVVVVVFVFIVFVVVVNVVDVVESAPCLAEVSCDLLSKVAIFL